MYDAATRERFWRHVRRSADGCWLWTGTRGPDGYGRFRIGGRLHKAHRVGWELENDRPFPEGYLAAHACAHAACVRADPNGTPREKAQHVYVATHSDVSLSYHERVQPPHRRS